MLKGEEEEEEKTCESNGTHSPEEEEEKKKSLVTRFYGFEGDAASAVSLIIPRQKCQKHSEVMAPKIETIANEEEEDILLGSRIKVLTAKFLQPGTAAVSDAGESEDGSAVTSGNQVNRATKNAGESFFKAEMCQIFLTLREKSNICGTKSKARKKTIFKGRLASQNKESLIKRRKRI